MILNSSFFSLVFVVVVVVVNAKYVFMSVTSCFVFTERLPNTFI